MQTLHEDVNVASYAKRDSHVDYRNASLSSIAPSSQHASQCSFTFQLKREPVSSMFQHRRELVSSASQQQNEVRNQCKTRVSIITDSHY